MTHELINPEELIPPIGFSHAVVAAPGRTVWLGGQTGHRADGSMDDGLVAQFAQAWGSPWRRRERDPSISSRWSSTRPIQPATETT